jgi:hypothetical protein
VADFEGDVDDDLEDAFGTLLVNHEDNGSGEEEPTDSSAPSFFTLVESLLTEPAISHTGSPYIEVLIKELNNQALMYQLMTQVPIDSTKPEELEETTTFTTGSMSRYNSHHFYGVVINTGALKYSTAGYGQFQAL